MVRKILYVILVLAQLAGVELLAQNNAIKLREFLPSDAMATGKILLVNSSQYYPKWQVTRNGILFDIATDRNGLIVYVSTIDTSFSTPEGIHIGDAALKVKPISKDSLRLDPGWAFYFPLHSEWNSAFPFTEVDENGNLLPEARVYFIFKSIYTY